jgi:RNA polymerase sigma-70 factor (ECF subfamily)
MDMQGRESAMNSDPSDRDDSDLPPDIAVFIKGAMQGDREALAQLFAFYRPRLWRMVNFRLHPRLQGRIDADDVLQDTWLMAVDRIRHFPRDASHSPFIWFRMIVNQALIDLHRRHIGAEKRSANRDVPIHGGWNADSTSSSLAFHLLGNMTSPSSAFNRAELARQLDLALQGMNEIDREVLALRHFEELSNSETAKVLNMSEQAASGRYIRALGRLKHVLQVLPGFPDQRQSNG